MDNNIFSLNGRVIVITGGSGFLGTRVVEGLRAHGADVAVADVAERGIEATGAVFVPCDLSSTESIRTMLRSVKKRFGRIDVLINAATYGAGYGPDGTVDRMSDEDWWKGLDGAAGTTFRCIREVVPYMEEQGGGVIVNFASMYGIVSPNPSIYGNSGANNPINYGAGKAAVLQMTRYCAAHLADKGIRVNCISPGPFPSSHDNETFMTELSRMTMLKRVGKAHEIVGPVILLCSPASSYMTGANIVVDGGWTSW